MLGADDRYLLTPLSGTLKGNENQFYIYSGAGFEVADVSYIPEKSYSRESDLSSTESIGFEISELEKFKCGNA